MGVYVKFCIRSTGYFRLSNTEFIIIPILTQKIPSLIFVIILFSYPIDDKKRRKKRQGKYFSLILKKNYWYFIVP